VSEHAFAGRRVVVGLCGSVAAYKACDAISRLRQEGAEVRVVATPNASRFVGLPTLRALSGADVACQMFDDAPQFEIEHISLAEFGEAFVIVAATANVIAKAAAGLCDDLLTTTLCAAAGQVILAPAMNWRMWGNPITRRNAQALRDLGYWFVGPECGHLACGEEGSGRLSPTADILDAVDQALGPAGSALRGKHVLITSGPTREWLDPVRFLSNPSTGKMGAALAREALARGARVSLVTGPTELRPPWRAEVTAVGSAAEMHQAVAALHPDCDVLIAAAAPADFAPAQTAPAKLKKTGEPLELAFQPTPDILASVAGAKGARIHVGFAAETHDLDANARGKLERKDLDLIAANDITAPGAGFAADTNAVTLFRRDGSSRPVAVCAKRQVAAAILDDVEALLP
jgi:phosphopantothenoylcysteine decarboxylase / phosphopantothenate---cysteine ligase